VTSSDESTDELVAFILTNENEPKDENKKKNENETNVKLNNSCV